MKKLSFSSFIIIVGFTLLFYLPLFFAPGIILNRGNDLQEQFWPVFYFIKNQIILNHTLPLWNNLFLAGLPLLPDPQFSFFYPINLFFLILPIDGGFLLSFFIHGFIGVMGMYVAVKRGLNFSNSTAIFTALAYIISPRLAGYLEAGHYGLVGTMAWFPWLIFALTLLLKKPNLSASLIISISLAGLFYTHAVTFIITFIMTATFFCLTLCLVKPIKKWWPSIKFFALGNTIALGLSAIALIPQLEWAPQTTRFLLLHDRDVYPKWASLKEFIQSIFYPVSGDSEKWLVVGITLIILSLIGFWTLNKKIKIILIILGMVTMAVASNNASPLYSLLINQDWYALMRVATRIWFIPFLIATILAGLGFDHLKNRGVRKRYLILIAATVTIELTTLFWSRLLQPVPPQDRFVPNSVYQFLQKDQTRFRVFCLNRCLSQQESAKASLELIEGYNTMQQKNYVQQVWQFSGTFWNYYTLATPPTGLYKFGKLKPDPVSLGLYNTKYIISPYVLEDNSFTLEKQLGSYYIYNNKLIWDRAYFVNEQRQPIANARIIKHSPNQIIIDTSEHQASRLVLAEVYSKGWRAYLDGKKEIPVQETPNALRLVDITSDTKFVDFKYQPDGYLIGQFITIGTILFLIILLVYHHGNHK